LIDLTHQPDPAILGLVTGEPSTLMEAIRFFADPDTCIRYFAERRWPDGPICPRCTGKDHYYLTSRRLWKCTACAKQFSVKVGTIFEDSSIGLDKWLTALWMLANDRNGISSHELHRSIGVCQKTAWFMLHRIRHAMQTGSFEKAKGPVEVDETFIGGKARNMHKHVRAQTVTGTGGKYKSAVMGILERGGTVRTRVVGDRKKTLLQAIVKEHVEPGAEIFTDALKSYEGLESNTCISSLTTLSST
jgi:transposase-like protein